MIIKPSRALIAVILFFLAQAAFSQNRNQSSAVFPRLEPDPKALEYYNLGQPAEAYTWTELAEISLWASGVTDASGITSNIEKIRAAVEQIKNSPQLPSAQKEIAEFILTFMHKNLLKSYSLYQTKIDTLLSGGRFNCVSSGVLYMILCKANGIDANGVMTKEHAFVMLHIDGKNIDVETTNEYGFDPGERKEFQDEIGRVTGFAYVPAQNYKDRQTITQIELVSLIMNNRIADNERQNRYAESVPIAIDRAALLFGNNLTTDNSVEVSEVIFRDPRYDLLDRVFNFGAMLLRANREEDALRWAAASSLLYPDKNRWQEFTLAAVNNHIMKLIKADRTTNARNFLEVYKIVLTEENYSKLDAMLLDAELLTQANQISNAGNAAAEGDAVINAIVMARTSGRISEERAEELLNFAILKTAYTISRNRNASPGNWRAALEFIENAVNRFGSNRELEQALSAYRSNIAADYHNRFAAEWNKRNFDEAERILNEALNEFPNDRQLIKNRETVNRQRPR